MYLIIRIYLDLLMSYLSNTFKYVLNKDNKSTLKNNKCGVPQGYVLENILCVLYINDLPNISSIFKPILFEDDTTVHFSYTYISTIENKIKCCI